MKHVARINGLNVTYYRLGSGRPLLFLHGGRVRARTFRRLITLLSRRYSIIAPDIPGYGGSDTPRDTWSFVEYAAFFNTFLNHLDLEKVTLVGYSMGGGIAANLAVTSNRIEKLVLIDASGVFFDKREQGHRDGQRLWFYLKHLQYVGALGVLLRDYLQFIWKHRRDWAHMKHIRQACFSTRYEANMRNISVPTQLLWGGSDWIYPLSVAHAFQLLIPQATLVTVPGNHDWPVYDPLLAKQHLI